MQILIGTLSSGQKECLEESGLCIVKVRSDLDAKAFRGAVLDASVDGVEVKLKVLAVQLGEDPGMICQRQ